MILSVFGNYEYRGVRVSEASLNGLPSAQIAERFPEHPYRFLVCADKFQTGCDEPLLHTMYVDKTLSGIKAVKTLSRLNRAHPKKHDVVILNFLNDADTIRAAFADFHRATILADETDPNKLHDPQADLDPVHVSSEDQIDDFVRRYLGGGRARPARSDPGRLRGGVCGVCARPGRGQPGGVQWQFNEHIGDIRWEDADRVTQLISETIPARIPADSAFRNARQNSNRQNARIEHDKALLRVMTAVMRDDTELFKQFMDNASAPADDAGGRRNWLCVPPASAVSTDDRSDWHFLPGLARLMRLSEAERAEDVLHEQRQVQFVARRGFELPDQVPVEVAGLRGFGVDQQPAAADLPAHGGGAGDHVL